MQTRIGSSSPEVLTTDFVLSSISSSFTALSIWLTVCRKLLFSNNKSAEKKKYRLVEFNVDFFLEAFPLKPHASLNRMYQSNTKTPSNFPWLIFGSRRGTELLYLKFLFSGKDI